MSRPFTVGERALLFDSKGRRYLVALAEGGEFHTHAGPIEHDQLIGKDEGITVRSRRGARYIAVRPTLAEVVLKMPRGAQVIYPKDLGPLLIMADVFPGARIFESGLGSGALSMALLRAGADITGYEVREDFAARAQANVAGFLGASALDRYHVEVRDSYAGVDARDIDRFVLDLPEPWQLVSHARTSLRPGGIFVAYLPTILQVATLRAELDRAGFGMAETVEILQRSWHIDGQSVRPDHRMVAHTGFLTSARLLDLGDAPPQPPAPAGEVEEPEPVGADIVPDPALS
ncbi:tRNA (adenine-N1)-methyltransferase [Acidiferrimicrobium sp. IK]|uniref:tRNA (adenine-N1)-methyltransferase n=1 Tax=Acidiferrimicrobium sp. IK TaxID=2871700 RepID=UPI0021CB7750|nr:tRNA (adenine-N1)-methyltransferase [Acidiferrimicrobium sp. IK]MCU4184655.1 tRNA (adenine-N1)-methyltransferase [Acidiferrimicrobium sp. IK]